MKESESGQATTQQGADRSEHAAAHGRWANLFED